MRTDYASLPRRQLQALAKARGIPANGKSATIILALNAQATATSPKTSESLVENTVKQAAEEVKALNDTQPAIPDYSATIERDKTDENGIKLLYAVGSLIGNVQTSMVTPLSEQQQVDVCPTTTVLSAKQSVDSISQAAFVNVDSPVSSKSSSRRQWADSPRISLNKMEDRKLITPELSEAEAPLESLTVSRKQKVSSDWESSLRRNSPAISKQQADFDSTSAAGKAVLELLTTRYSDFFFVVDRYEGVVFS